jgi:hypothetical protein
MPNDETKDKDNLTPLNVINRLMRRTAVSDRTGVTAILEQLEISPIPLAAVVPMALSITTASITDLERRRRRIPLSYIFDEAYLLGNKGAKRFAFMYKDLAQEQIAGQNEEEVEGAED